ncbi:MAG: glycosyltransferase [Candidatus Brocadiales bacterium]
MMKILYISSLRNACTYYRCTLPARHLHKKGLAETRIVSGIAKEYIDWADLVVLQRVVGDIMYHAVRYARLEGKKVVYELDDNIFKYPDSVEYVRKGVQAETLSALRIIRSVDAVTTSTDAIAGTLRELTDTPVYVLPNQIDFADVERMNFSAGKQLSIGWAGGHYHVQDLGLVEAALESVLQKYPEVVLIMYGACPKGLYERNKTRIFLQQFMPVEEFHFWMASFRFDIGIAPLYKVEFAKSRSNLRLLQYAAMKIPVVASNFGEYGRALGNGLAGLLAEDDQWVDKISHLIEHADERKRLAEAAHGYVRENYDIEKNIGRWSAAYEEVMTG